MNHSDETIIDLQFNQIEQDPVHDYGALLGRLSGELYGWRAGQGATDETARVEAQTEDADRRQVRLVSERAGSLLVAIEDETYRFSDGALLRLPQDGQAEPELVRANDEGVRTALQVVSVVRAARFDDSEW